MDRDTLWDLIESVQTQAESVRKARTYIDGGVAGRALAEAWDDLYPYLCEKLNHG